MAREYGKSRAKDRKIELKKLEKELDEFSQQENYTQSQINRIDQLKKRNK